MRRIFVKSYRQRSSKIGGNTKRRRYNRNIKGGVRFSKALVSVRARTAYDKNIKQMHAASTAHKKAIHEENAAERVAKGKPSSSREFAALQTARRKSNRTHKKFNLVNTKIVKEAQDMNKGLAPTRARSAPGHDDIRRAATP
jgi:hypothetical protein